MNRFAAWLRQEETPLGQVPMHERLRVGLCLTFVGGFLEAYTYLLHGGVFANAQTGNLALMAIYAVQKNVHALYYLWPVGAFLAGVLVSEWMRTKLSAKGRALWHRALVLAEAVLMAAVAFLPTSWPDAVVIVLVSFQCSLQFNGFRTTHGMAYATTFCTGNLRSAGENLYHAVAGRDRGRALAALRYFSVIFVFMAGACVGVACVGWFGAKAILLCTAVALAAFAMLAAGE